jgi:hypothetical protein
MPPMPLEIVDRLGLDRVTFDCRHRPPQHVVKTMLTTIVGCTESYARIKRLPVGLTDDLADLVGAPGWGGPMIVAHGRRVRPLSCVCAIIPTPAGELSAID